MGEFSHDFGAHIIPAGLRDRDLKIYLVRVSGRCSEGEGQKKSKSQGTLTVGQRAKWTFS